MNLRLPQWTKAWEKPYDPLQYLITPSELHIYIFILFCFKLSPHPSRRHLGVQLKDYLYY